MRSIRASSVAFDSTRKIVEDEESLTVPAILTRESILPFAEGKGYRSAKELERAADSLDHAYIVTRSHIPTVFPTNLADTKGRVVNVRFDHTINGAVGDLRFNKAAIDPQFLEDVRAGKLKDVSVAYYCNDIFKPGVWAGEQYDFYQENFFLGHVAAGVPEGSCPSPYVGMTVDSMFCRSHLDSEITEQYVRVRVRDPNLFVSGTFRTVALNASEGVHAVVGKLKSTSQVLVQDFMFDREKDWTMDKALAWVKEHGDSVLPKTAEIVDVPNVFSCASDVYGDSGFLVEIRVSQVETEGSNAQSDSESPGPSALDPEVVLARSRRLLSNMFP